MGYNILDELHAHKDAVADGESPLGYNPQEAHIDLQRGL